MKKFYFAIIFLLGILFCSFVSAAGLFFNVSLSGNSLVITTTIPNHVYPNAGVKINTPGYSLKYAGTECTPNSNGYCLFSANDTTPTAITLQGPAGIVSFNLCLNGAGPLSCQKYNVSITTSPRFAYIGNFGSDDFLFCSVDADSGNFNNCNFIGAGFSRPVSFAVNPASTYAYVADFDNGVSTCIFNSTTGGISNCAGGATVNSPVWIKLNSTGTLAYVSDYTDSLVYKCTVDPASGLLDTCTSTGSGFDGPQQIVFNNANTRAYIGNWLVDKVTLCQIDSGTGDFINCTPATPAFGRPTGIALSPNGAFAYVTDLETVHQCNVNPSTGDLSNCKITGTGFNGPDTIAINPAGSILYATNYGDSSVSQCNINPITGALVDCAYTGSGFSSFTSGITLY